ncbi:MAG: hypothetical protein OXF51_01635, partial [Alphaproteobacteria bacterium]|nr:hypothetical protein [Alphaproteobacteria bacterium]
LFSAEVMPHFKAGEAEREARKAQELAPWIEAALARKLRMAPLAEADIPQIGAFGRNIVQTEQDPYARSTHHAAADITVPASDPMAREEAAAAEE